jgi:periplasmic nitrate reductase NapD
MCTSIAVSRRDVLTGQRAGFPAPSEAHISSLVVHVRAADIPAFRGALARISGAELHAEEGGKCVVTLETASEAEIVTRLNEISLLAGVLSAALVFHQVETDPPASPAAQG